MTERALSPQISADLGEDGVAVERVPWSVYIVHLRLAGEPNEVRWTERGRTVSVRSLPLSTTMWSFGPVLPILPRFGTSSSPQDLQIDVSVRGAPGGTRARLAEFTLALPDRREPLRPSGVRVPASADSPLRGLDGDGEAVVDLDGTGSMRLSYPVDRASVDAAQLTVRFAGEDGTWTFRRCARFLRGGTTFVMMIP
jgi:hypothetical protein